ncbi:MULTISPECIES: hypothetical protein [Actinosynnema]|uniref:hypothetical protein n=1 Tax=Actinosynnema TaxID=40566 RepID=UPI0020A595FC|nr:hypothetical protein [Actinosynnema pretiosum]
MHVDHAEVADGGDHDVHEVLALVPTMVVVPRLLPVTPVSGPELLAVTHRVTARLPRLDRDP